METVETCLKYEMLYFPALRELCRLHINNISVIVNQSNSTLSPLDLAKPSSQ